MLRDGGGGGSPRFLKLPPGVVVPDRTRSEELASIGAIFLAAVPEESRVLSPVERLVFAFVWQAWCDAFGRLPTEHKERWKRQEEIQARASARHWLLEVSDDDDYFTLDWACAVLGWRADKVREAAKKTLIHGTDPRLISANGRRSVRRSLGRMRMSAYNVSKKGEKGVVWHSISNRKKHA